MATPAQAAAATVGAGSLAAAGAYGITQAVNGSGEETTTEEQESQTDNKIPTPATFTKNDLTDYTSKFLSLTKEENLQFLVKPDNNEDWWKWAFENKYQTKKVDNQRHNLFTSVNNSETLKTACQEAYKQDKTKYLFTDNDYLLENISTFCTKSAEKHDVSEPRVTTYTTNEATADYTNGLLSVEGNKTKLVKTKEENNNNVDLWWKWAFKNIFVKEGAKSPFDTVTEGFSSSDNNTALNNACNTGYKKTFTDLKPNATNSNLLTEIKKFCSVNKEQTLLVLPEPATATAINGASSNYQTEKSLGKESSNRAHLINPKEANNQEWWEWSYLTRYPINDAAAKAALPDLFKTIDKGYEAISGSEGTSFKALNKACSKAYDETHDGLGDTTDDKSLISTVKKFCTKNLTNTTLTRPNK